MTNESAADNNTSGNNVTNSANDNLESALKTLIVEECDKDIAPDAIDNDAELIGGVYDLDSLDALQICVAVQNRYGVRIQSGPDARKSLANVASLAQAVRERRTDSH